MRPRWICRCVKCWSGTGPTRVAPPVTRDSILSDWRSKHSIRSAGGEPTIWAGARSMLGPPSREASKERDCRESGSTFATTAKTISCAAFIGKLLAYALGRSLALSDDLLIQESRGKLDDRRLLF